MTDTDALSLYARHRDAEAFAYLVATYKDLVYGTALRELRHRADAEDATQETFVRLARSAGSIRESLAAWLHITARNAARDIARKSGTRRRHEEAAATVHVEVADGEPAWTEVREALDAALVELDEAQRTLILQRYFAGRTQADMAAEQGVSQPMMSRRLKDAIESLREKLADKGFGIGAGTLAAGLTAEAAAIAAPATLTASLTAVGVAGIKVSTATAAGGIGVAAVAALSGAGLIVAGALVTSVFFASEPAATSAVPANALEAPAALSRTPDQRIAGLWSGMRATPEGPTEAFFWSDGFRFALYHPSSGDGTYGNFVDDVPGRWPTAVTAIVDEVRRLATYDVDQAVLRFSVAPPDHVQYPPLLAEINGTGAPGFDHYEFRRHDGPAVWFVPIDEPRMGVPHRVVGAEQEMVRGDGLLHNLLLAAYAVRPDEQLVYEVQLPLDPFSQRFHAEAHGPDAFDLLRDHLESRFGFNERREPGRVILESATADGSEVELHDIDEGPPQVLDFGSGIADATARERELITGGPGGVYDLAVDHARSSWGLLSLGRTRLFRLPSGAASTRVLAPDQVAEAVAQQQPIPGLERGGYRVHMVNDLLSPGSDAVELIFQEATGEVGWLRITSFDESRQSLRVRWRRTGRADLQQ